MLKKTFFFLLLFTLTYTSSQNNTAGAISATNEVYDGYTLFSVHKKTFLINNCGQVINEWNSDYLPSHSVYILPNGNLIRAGKAGNSAINFGGVGGIVEMFDWDGNLLWEFNYSNDNERLHHDIYPLANGNILVLAATLMTEQEAIQAGRNPSLLSENSLYNEQILEIQPVGTNQFNVIWEWNIKDHLIQDFDNTKDNFGNVEDSPEKLDINFLNGGAGGANWLHVNSIQYDETLDQIVVSSRNLSEFWIIDHSTTTQEAASSSGGVYGKGGDLLYRWGNPQSYRQGDANDRRLFGQHYPHYIKPGLKDAGKIILFNNGVTRTPLFSEVFILSPSASTPGFYNYTPNTAYEPEFPEFVYADQANFFSGILSSAVRLPNDNILICDGDSGRFFELNSNNEIVWEYIIPVNNSTGDITAQGNPVLPGNSTFRAIKYSKNYVGFVGRDLTPANPIETNFNLNVCNTLSNGDATIKEFKFYPNPVSSILSFKTQLQVSKIEVFSLLGKKQNIYKFDKNSINISSLSNGIYLIQIYTDKGIVTDKFIKN